MLNSNDKQQISRYELKKQLEEGIQSFDISSFGQSKNQSINIKALLSGNQSLFPSVDAPTLDLLEDSQYNIRYLDTEKDLKVSNKNKKHAEKHAEKKLNQYYEDLTARNKPTHNQNEQKINKLEKQLKKIQQKLQNQTKQKRQLQQQINSELVNHKKIVEELKQKNKLQKQQIKLLKERQIKSTREKQILQKQLSQNSSKNSTVRDTRTGSVTSISSIYGSTVLNASYLDDPSLFCPQLLSPEETVTLLSKLLKKVSNSSKMIKQLTDDPCVKTILHRIQKR